MRVIVAVSGASGALYALEVLRRLKRGGHEIHAVISEYGWNILAHECNATRPDILALADYLYDNDDLAAPIASGSFRVDAMVAAPCSMRSLAAIAGGLAGTLMCRAADVMLKERKNLVLAVRETPLSAVHLENMLKLARLGVGIVPLCPGYYHRPQSIEELVAMMAGRILDSLGVTEEDIPRWRGL